MKIPSVPNLGMMDGNLSRRFSNLSDGEKNKIIGTYGEINAKNINRLDDNRRGDLKTAIDTAEKADAENKQKETKVKREGEIKSVKDKGMGDDELEGGNRLIFIGTGSGGSSGADFNKNLTAMKNSTYYAATFERSSIGRGNANIKEISSITNNVEPVVDADKIIPVFELTQQSMVKVAAAKNAEKRDRLTKVLSEELGALLPDGLNNLKFANKFKQSLQIVFGYDIVDEKMKGKGRVQFVPQIGDPVSSAIIIENNEYVFDNKALQDMKKVGKEAREVISQLTGQDITEKKETVGNDDDNNDDSLGTSAQIPRGGPQGNNQSNSTNPFDNLGGKKRKTYRKKKASKAKRSKAAKKTRKVRRKMRKSKR
jgi:hypothetical protein